MNGADESSKPADSGLVDDAMVDRAFRAMDTVFAYARPCLDRRLTEEDKSLALKGIRAALEAALAAQLEQITDGKAQWDEVANILGADGDNVDDVIAKATALAAQGQGDVEVARLQGVIERDRTVFCGLIAGLKRELQTREWLGNENARAAGGYRYDEPGFISEFGEAWTAIMGALERAHRTFQDFTDCPSGEAIRNAQADAQAILDRHAERARVPDSVNGQAIELLIAGGYVTRNKAMDAIDIARAAAPSAPECGEVGL